MAKNRQKAIGQPQYWTKTATECNKQNNGMPLEISISAKYAHNFIFTFCHTYMMVP